jgi:hypothetical protein
MFVMTIDQRGSRTVGDRVPELLATLRGIRTVLPFERSVGDEVQGLLDAPAGVVEAAMRALRAGGWYVGIGVGSVDRPLPASPREAAGPALVQARLAVDRAKRTGERVALAVEYDGGSGLPGEGAAAASAAEAVLVRVGDLVRHRSAAEWRVLDALAEPGPRRQVDVAQSLGVTPQAVSQAILRSGRQEEQRGRAAAELLLTLAGRAVDGGPGAGVSGRG